MKTSIILSITFLCFTLLSGCINNDNGNPSSSGSKALKMKIAGQEWKATKNISAYAAFLNSSGDGVVIAGYDEEGNLFQISTDREVTGEGTYTVPGPGGGGLQFHHPNGKIYVEESLTVKITKIHQVGKSKYVEGTFEGTAENLTDETDKITITEGLFDGME